MAERAIEFMLDNLTQLLKYNLNLIRGAKAEVEKLESDLRKFNAFLIDSTKKRRNDETMRNKVREIRELVYDAEDVIDAFVTQEMESKTKKYFTAAFQTPVDHLVIANKVQAVRDMINHICGDKNWNEFPSSGVRDEDVRKETGTIKPKKVVGFDGETDKLIGYLTEETEKLDAITVVGLPGQGKTTLARKIFDDPRIQYEFPVRIWVDVSQDFTNTSIFLGILKEFTRLTDDIRRESEQQLAQRVAAHLERGKFLIVMDDVWTSNDWDKLKISLPESNKLGRVLITSRNTEVARRANGRRKPHELRFLTTQESWLLLRYEVFGEPQCPPELEIYGERIANDCDRLPLAIVVIGGILTEKVSAADPMNERVNAWRNVSEHVHAYLISQVDRVGKIIALSYEKLPYHLRECFLYFGIFPEDCVIPAWNLTRMWIAEGFIQSGRNMMGLEVTAEKYLDDLINRNLVRVEERRADGKVKTCKIHDVLREFCQTQATNEMDNFLQEMKKSREGIWVPQVAEVKKFRRLSLHSNILEFVESKPVGPRIRSFVCFAKEETPLPLEHNTAITSAFKLLRVLEVKPIKFSKIPGDLSHLIHLRFIHLSFSNKVSVLPKQFSKFWNMQTLVIDAASGTLEIKADIWSMTELRHVKTNASAILPSPTKSSRVCEKLQTLGTISPESCSEYFFDKARNLKELGIRGRLALLMDAKKGSFQSLGKLDKLEKLKLLNDVVHSQSSEGQLSCLPPAYQFPKELRSLTLSYTFLDWPQMSILGSLGELEVLKLKDKSFKGSHWLTADGGFRKLQFLHIGRTDLTFWKASGLHFPRLCRLELHNCEQLIEVPIGLADIPSLQQLDLNRTILAAASAKQIKDKKGQKMQQEQPSSVNEFKLSIFPPSEE